MMIQLRVDGPRLGIAAFATAPALEPGCEVAMRRGGRYQTAPHVEH